MSEAAAPYRPPHQGRRTFLIVWVTQSISVFGSALTFFSITIWVTQVLYPQPEQKPELAAALSVISLAFALPTVFGAPLAGAWADRHDRKRTMIMMDLVSGLISLTVAVLMLTHGLRLWMLVDIVVLASTVGAFHFSAFDSSYAMLVPERLLPRANGMMQTIWSLSGILSLPTAAAIIAVPALARQGHIPRVMGEALGGLTNGAPLAITIDAITFFQAALALVFLHILSPKRTDLGQASGGPKKSIWADVREGALYIWLRRPLLWLLGTFAVVNLLSAPAGVFMPLVVKFNRAGDWSARGYSFETALALLSMVSSMGGVMAAFALAQLFNPYVLRVEDKAWLDELAARAERKTRLPA